MDKFTLLIKILKDMESVLISYSGGVDSTLLLKAVQTSGIRAAAFTADSEVMPRQEISLAKRTARGLGFKLKIIDTDELSSRAFVLNTPERCYVCKDNRFRIFNGIAIAEGYGFVIDGSNADDTREFRPGMKAAAERGVRSPLIEAAFSKEEIRREAKRLGLDVWNKPSSPCLATRIPYGTRITAEALKRIERSESFLRSIGFREVRVRDYGDAARIEAGRDEIRELLDAGRRETIVRSLRRYGYATVSVDLEGYRHADAKPPRNTGL